MTTKKEGERDAHDKKRRERTPSDVKDGKDDVMRAYVCWHEVCTIDLSLYHVSKDIFI